jgi:hypothetical protein
MKALMLIVLLFIAAPSTAAKRPLIRSVYTSIDLHHCKTLKEMDEGAYSLRRCPGYAGIPVFVEIDDERADVSAGSAGGEICVNSIGCTFTTEGETVEWRLRNGKPFAIIYRVYAELPDGTCKIAKTWVLVIETIGSRKRPGCRIAEIPSAKPNANLLAQAAAAQALAEKVKCRSGR